jgi:hypothetical protein
VSDKKIILVGYSGHGFVVADAAIESGSVVLWDVTDGEIMLGNTAKTKE